MNPDGFLADVLAGPQVLRDVAAAYRAGDLFAGVPTLPRVVFVGMGSSRFAALDCMSALRARGIDAHVEYASTGCPQPPSSETLCVAVSAGGGSRETLTAVERHRGVGTTVAVTNRADSQLAAGCDVVLPLHAGDEAGGVASRTFHATVAVLQMLAARLAGDPLEPVLERVAAAAGTLDHVLGTREAWLPSVADAVGDGPVWIAAPAERLGSAEQSALMFREGPRITAGACETGDWSHVDVYLSKHAGYRLLLLGGSEWEDELLGWVRERASVLVAVGRQIDDAAAHVSLHDATETATLSLVETAVAELVAWSLWRDASAGLGVGAPGIEPGTSRV